MKSADCGHACLPPLFPPAHPNAHLRSPSERAYTTASGTPLVQPAPGRSAPRRHVRSAERRISAPARRPRRAGGGHRQASCRVCAFRRDDGHSAANRASSDPGRPAALSFDTNTARDVRAPKGALASLPLYHCDIRYVYTSCRAYREAARDAAVGMRIRRPGSRSRGTPAGAPAQRHSSELPLKPPDARVAVHGCACCAGIIQIWRAQADHAYWHLVA
ncbi:hypothetical protein DFH11DRAFT_1813131, partial [Phellopilus nigrolimitatus]